MIVTILEASSKRIQKKTSEGILVKIIPSLDWGDLDFLLNDRLARDQGDQHRVKHQFFDNIHVDAKL